MTILVTDAGGMVGRHLVRELLADGHAVRAVAGAADAVTLPPQAEVAEGDFTDPAALAAVFDGITAAHLVSADTDTTTLPGVDEIVHRARTAGVSRVTVVRRDHHPGPLEQAITEDGGLRWTWLCATQLMADTLRWAAAVRDEGEVTDTAPHGPSALVHEADVAAVAAAALTGTAHAQQDFRLTGPQALTSAEQVLVISDVLGREISYRAPGPGAIGGVRQESQGPAPAVVPTVEHVTGRSPRTFATWVRENADAFGGTGVVTG